MWQQMQTSSGSLCSKTNTYGVKIFYLCSHRNKPLSLAKAYLNEEKLHKKGCVVEWAMGGISKSGRDAWIPNEPNFKPRLRIGAEPKYQYVSDLILHDSRQWDKGKLNEIFHQETNKNILQIHLPIILKEDSFIWATNSAGSFSVKSVYLTDQKHRFDFCGCSNFAKCHVSPYNWSGMG